MSKQVLIAGAGIGGLAAALACARAGRGVHLFERSGQFSGVGAGIQIGPNVTRILDGWGLSEALTRVAAFPSHLQVCQAGSGVELGVLRLGSTARQRYGAPYATLHRADLHQLLLDALRRHTDAEMQLDCALAGFTQSPSLVTARMDDGRLIEGGVLLGADGLWSAVRRCLLDDGPPRRTGHLAYRALVPQSSLPQARRSQHITAWLGPNLHVVHYPVRGGAWLNIVGIVHACAVAAPDADSLMQPDEAGCQDYWDQATTAAGLRNALAGACSALQDLIGAVEVWRRWTLYDRSPVRGAAQLAAGRVALLGDAAHPMRPYLAQGAGMAIEDAAALGAVLEGSGNDVGAALRVYALQRWQRNARVQARAMRNGQIFHARGLLRWGRDTALKVLGERVLDLPWLYRH